MTTVFHTNGRQVKTDEIPGFTGEYKVRETELFYGIHFANSIFSKTSLHSVCNNILIDEYICYNIW